MHVICVNVKTLVLDLKLRAHVGGSENRGRTKQNRRKSHARVLDHDFDLSDTLCQCLIHSVHLELRDLLCVQIAHSRVTDFAQIGAIHSVDE